MVDTQETEQNNSLDSFLKKKNTQENSSLEKAQRLVNLYHHLSAFGPEFNKEYTQMLLDAPSDVQTMLNSIIGGQIVRQYIDFLKKEQSTDNNYTSDDTPSFSLENEGYLPSPDEDLNDMIQIPNTTLESNTSFQIEPFMKAMIKIQQKEAERQSIFLQQALEKMQSVLLQQINKKNIPSEEQESNRLNQTEIINQTVEKIVKAQTDVMVKAFQKASENTREIAARQTNRLMDYLKSQDKKENHYSDIIETPKHQNMTEQVSSTLTSPQAPIIPNTQNDTTGGTNNA